MHGRAGKPSVRQADQVVVTGQLTEDMLHLAEIGGGRYGDTGKRKDAELSQAENVMIERMMKRQIRVRIMRAGEFRVLFRKRGDWFTCRTMITREAV